MLPTNASLDRLLALLVLVEGGTGLLALGAGTPSLGWVFVLHGLVSGALFAAVVLKLWRSVPHAVASGRRLRLIVGLLVAVIALAALAGGFAWVASGRLLRVGPWTVLTLHAWAGLLLVALVAVHLAPRRWLLLRSGPRPVAAAQRRLLSRRAFLAGTAFAAASVLLYGGAGLLDRALGGTRRFTGSRPLPGGGVPPTTTFLGEATPSVDREAWRLSIVGRVERAATYGPADLASVVQVERVATLDCTSGWAMTTTWGGVPLSALLAAAHPASGATWIDVRSVTGWSTRLSIDEARDCVLATGVAGGPLPVENGAPCRLVVPGRRGLDWVKWVAEIEVG